MNDGPSGLDPQPLLEKYKRYGGLLKLFWPISVFSFIAAAVLLFASIPGNYKGLQTTQRIFNMTLHPTDSSVIRLLLKGKPNMLIESKDYGEHYTIISNNPDSISESDLYFDLPSGATFNNTDSKEVKGGVGNTVESTSEHPKR